MACTPTFTASGIWDAGQEFHLTGKITFAVGDVYPSGGIPITTVFNCITEKSGKYPYDIMGTAFNPMFTGAPAKPVITQAGTPGAKTDGYTIVKKRSDGTLLVGAEETTTASATTMNGTNYNVVTWMVEAGYVYDVYRTTVDGTHVAPTTVGIIAADTVTSPVLDKALVGDTTTPPSDSTASPLYEAWFDKTSKTLRLGGDTAECSSTTLTDVVISVSAWAKRITG